ncbi:cysteine-rich secretory protein 1 isoform X1 [Artibeus jamaicensis]|uniref:cysteine-rich secretory protein 1 isoform X1 n=1 Tax=Artibeus jamaicensis TaxID=9417 RepID=UPI00235AE4A9|nr:cysteine-rich secretory protein 1 isoform X1 [Artibeus jamaicensis]
MTMKRFLFLAAVAGFLPVLISWSEEAAQNARLLSKKCDSAKSNAVRRRIAYTFCGENKYLATDAISWLDVIGTWYNESQDFHYGLWSPVSDDKSDHYTQMIWASSYLIGCGVSPCCKKMSFQYLYVCHYCHEGNEPERKSLPYNLGSPCEACPSNCDNGLCTNPCIYYDEYTNCGMLKLRYGCNHQSVKLLCKASCLCTTEIT